MTTVFTLDAEPREDMGKGASRRLRRTGKVPAIIYGAEQAPVALTLDHNALFHSVRQEAFFNHILEIKVQGGRTERAVLKDLQRHPARPFILHVDFQRVAEDHELQVHIPLHFTGEESAPGVKQEGGAISHHLADVEVRCLPANMPEFIEVDVSQLHLNDVIKLSDLVVPDGVTIALLAHSSEHDAPVVSIHPTRGGEEDESEAGEPAPDE